eukprot:TRINITY_DN4267_c0_g2_i3.p1 TRINITY_DN4267_c0_g2~~TRINITY_DN4267_c0_g2_i3.p1  ORF type:complete len:188 (+),score=25.60 TRINITY_DN4267_c0_g2_i3:35-598(+)
MSNVLANGSLFNFNPWGGPCIVEWRGNDVWMRRTDGNFEGSRCFKTQNGDGQRLASLNYVVKIQWDNGTDYIEAFMPDKDTILVRQNITLNPFTRIKEDPFPANGDEAWNRLLEGNKRFVGDFSSNGYLDKLSKEVDTPARTALCSGQKPFVTLMTCADSRCSPEIIFNQGLGKIFVVRTAGNFWRL